MDGAGVGSGDQPMKYALESVTLVTFAAFLAWSVKIIVGWA